MQVTFYWPHPFVVRFLGLCLVKLEGFGNLSLKLCVGTFCSENWVSIVKFVLDLV